MGLQLITKQQLETVLSQYFDNRFKSLEKNILSKNANDEILTREQTANLLQINLSSLWAWTKAGKLRSYGVSGARRYYKRSEVLEALILIKK